MKSDRLPDGNDIQRWYPASFAETLGNSDIVKFFSNAARLGTRIPNVLIIGDSRSCKTAIVKTFARAVLCHNLQLPECIPCGECSACKDDLGRSGCEGIFAHAQLDGKRRSTPIHFVAVNCRELNESDLQDLLGRVHSYDGRRIVHLDEVHHLRTRSLDELLLKPLEDRNVAWIATTARPNGLDPMFLNRFPIKFKTTLPSTVDLAVWLARRCKAWSIGFDDPASFIRLAERANSSPGKALHALIEAACLADRTLTRELIDNHVFDLPE